MERNGIDKLKKSLHNTPVGRCGHIQFQRCGY